MTRERLAERILEVAHLTGEFELRSGAISNEYFDKYQFESDPEILQNIGMQMAEMIDDDFDYLGALEMGGIPVATASSFAMKKPVIFVRKKAKEYGTQKFAEGPEIKGKKILIIEDVVTSGGQIILSTKDLREAGATIEKAICVINREAGGKETLDENGIKLESLFTMSQLKK